MARNTGKSKPFDEEAARVNDHLEQRPSRIFRVLRNRRVVGSIGALMFAGLTACFGPTVLRGVNNAYNAVTGRNRIVFGVDEDNHAASFTAVEGWKTSLNPVKNIRALAGPLPDGTSWLQQDDQVAGLLVSGPANVSAQGPQNERFTVILALADRTPETDADRPEAVTEVALDLNGQTVPDPWVHTQNVVEYGAAQQRDGVRTDCEPGDTTQRKVLAKAELPSGTSVPIVEGTLTGCVPGEMVINRRGLQNLAAEF